MSTEKEWPALPEKIYGVGGAVDIEVSEELINSNHLGRFDGGKRLIRISAGKPEVMWATLFHEMVEMSLWDSGVMQFFQTKKMHRAKEAVCDAIAQGMLAQFREDEGL